MKDRIKHTRSLFTLASVCLLLAPIGCSSLTLSDAAWETWDNDVKPQALAGNELIDDPFLRDSKLEAINRLDSALDSARTVVPNE